MIERTSCEARLSIPVLCGVIAVHATLIWRIASTEVDSRHVSNTPNLIFFNVIPSSPKSEPMSETIPLSKAMDTVKPKKIEQIERSVQRLIRKAPPSIAAPARVVPSDESIAPTPIKGILSEAAPAVAMSVPMNDPAPIEAAAPADLVIPPHTDAVNLKNPVPTYPVMSRRLREQGRVLLDVHVLADGSVGEVRLKHSSGHIRLDQAAIRAVRVWRYVPARRNDLPISYWYVQPVVFALDE